MTRKDIIFTIFILIALWATYSAYQEPPPRVSVEATSDVEPSVLDQPIP